MFIHEASEGIKSECFLISFGKTDSERRTARFDIRITSDESLEAVPDVVLRDLLICWSRRDHNGGLSQIICKGGLDDCLSVTMPYSLNNSAPAEGLDRGISTELSQSGRAIFRVELPLLDVFDTVSVTEETKRLDGVLAFVEKKEKSSKTNLAFTPSGLELAIIDRSLFNHSFDVSLCIALKAPDSAPVVS